MKKEIHMGRGRAVVEEMARKIEETFNSFDVPIKIIKAVEGLHRYHFHFKTLKPVRMKAIESFEKDLQYALASSKLEIQAPMPDETLIGITIPKIYTLPKISWADAVKSKQFTKTDDLVVPLGQGEFGEEEFLNIRTMPHLLIGGATGSGKSVFLDSIINSLIHKHEPDRLRFILVDPKRWGLVQYDELPHLLTPVIIDPKKVIFALKWCIKEMERRLDIFQEYQCLNISSYHENVYENSKFKKSKPESLPYIVVIIDELSDLMACYPKELESCVVRLAQMSRAVGIHLILSTQRPSVNVVTGIMKANLLTRIAFQVASQIDSRTILDVAGAEKLLGAGDMLYCPPDLVHPKRIQGYYLSDEDIQKNIKNTIKKYRANPDSIFSSETDPDEVDELYEEVKRVVIESGKVSTSFIQRKLGIGYSRAARLIDLLEEKGIISAGQGSKPREVLRDEE